MASHGAGTPAPAAPLGPTVHGAGIPPGSPFSPDGRLFATAAGEAARVLARRRSDLCLRPTTAPSSPSSGVSFNPDGTLLMTSRTTQGLFHNERLAAGGRWCSTSPATFSQRASLQSVPLVATGGRDDLAMVWDSRDGSKRFQTVVHGGDVTELAWSPNADLFATASSDNGGRVFRADTGALSTFLGAHTNQVVGITFSPDGGTIATASIDGSAHIWTAAPTFAQHKSLLGHSRPVRDVGFTSDGRSVVTASDDGSVRVWQPAVDPILSLVGRHGAAGRAVAISPDGSLIASVGWTASSRSGGETGARSAASFTRLSFSTLRSRGTGSSLSPQARTASPGSGGWPMALRCSRSGTAPR